MPPPPLRTGGLSPLPRAGSGKLPEFPPEASAPADGVQNAAASRDFSTPSSSAGEKGAMRPSIPLPDFKPLFGYDDAVPVPHEGSPSAPAPVEQGPESAPGLPGGEFFASEPEDEAVTREERTSALGFDPATIPVESTDLSDVDEEKQAETRIQELEERLSLVTEERDQDQAELEILRQQSGGKSDAALAEVEAVGRERDEARMEVIVLRSQLEAAEQTQRDTAAMASQLEELSHVIDERDSVRRDYATLREQFETLKLDRSRGDATEEIQRLDEENRRLSEQLTRAGSAKGAADAAPVSADVATLREELKKAKEEASMSARGLALSQKALQETREALKAASEGPASPKGSQEDWKKERATLVRQNMLLQGQNEQLTRDLSAAKARLGAQES